MSDPGHGARSGWARKFYRLFNTDWVFLIFAAMVAMLIGEPLIEGQGGDVRNYAIIAALAVVFAIVASLLSRFDRKFIEDYQYRLIAQGAVVAILGTIFAVAAYDWLSIGPGPLEGREIMLIVVTAWITGYFWHRWRGLDT